jgi:hypothetical protein
VIRALVVLGVLTGTAHADVIFTREGALWRGDAQLAAVTGEVRALATDAGGTVLFADVGGTWHWMPLDGTATALAPLPCTGHPLLHPSKTCVVCAVGAETAFIRLENGLSVTRALPGATVTGTASAPRLIWSDAGIWSAPFADVGQKTLVAPESPARGLSIAPDGSRALGVFPGVVGRKREPGELLYSFALDGTAARRKAIRDGIPVQWSADSQWVLVQDGARACVMRAVGGEYRCWKGYTGVSIAPDGMHALLLGRRRDATAEEEREAARPSGAAAEGEAGGDDAHVDEHVPLPTGPLSLYQADFAGAHTKRPTLIQRVVDGPAVWIAQPVPVPVPVPVPDPGGSGAGP